MKQKLLALNVPAEFEETRKAIQGQKVSQTLSGTKSVRIRPKFATLVKDLLGQDAEQAAKDSVAERLHQVAATYETLLLTLDQSVPVAPVKESIVRLRGAIRRFKISLYSPERDEIALKTMASERHRIGDLSEDFAAASTLAQRVYLVTNAVAMFDTMLAEAEELFQYKSGLTGKGRPSTYSLVYVVSALIEVYETHGFQQRKAWFPAESRPENQNEIACVPKQILFDQFLLGFLAEVNPAELYDPGYLYKTDWFNRMTEKVQAAKLIPGLHQLLDGNPDTANVLKFMEQADKVKA